VPCELASMQLHAYFDGELDAPAAAAFEQHLSSCEECRAALDSEEALRNAITRANLYEPAPASIRRAIRSELPAKPTTIRSVNPAWRALALAATLLLVASLSWQLLPRFRQDGGRSQVIAAALDAHLRSLQPGHLADVQSTDQHTVKPWFDGKVDFAPPVRDFTADGFPLLGGRADVLNGRTVAAVVYGRRKHIISVFVWPSSGSDATTTAQSGSSKGYNWLSWRSGGFEFCAVSDVNPADLVQLQTLFANQ
jgi:anti-sigma factor (TIGR02949 family)